MDCDRGTRRVHPVRQGRRHPWPCRRFVCGTQPVPMLFGPDSSFSEYCLSGLLCRGKLKSTPFTLALILNQWKIAATSGKPRPCKYIYPSCYHSSVGTRIWTAVVGLGVHTPCANKRTRCRIASGGCTLGLFRSLRMLWMDGAFSSSLFGAVPHSESLPSCV